MNKISTIFAVAVLTTIAAGANASEPARQAATAELPAALAALQGDQVEVLTEEQAAQVRGQWWIYFPLYKQAGGEVFIYGAGKPFELKLHTVSAKNLYQPIKLRIKIGH